MNRPLVFAALMLLALAAAAAFRLPRLERRLVHGDEAGQAVKLGLLLEKGEYRYDPREYHGPSLNYLTLPVVRLAGARALVEVDEFELRLVVAVFGIALVGLVWLLADGLGRTASFCAAALAAVSPAMVFYSRYYIQEMLLVAFTLGAIAALWRYRQAALAGAGQAAPPRRRWLREGAWAVAFGACLGMMHASKETCVIAMAALGLAAAATLYNLRRVGLRRLALAASLAVLVAAGISALFFSSFLHNPHGVVDSYTAFAHYLGRASGEGTAGRHAYPWYHYFRLLFWWRAGGGPLWTEAAIAVLALVGLAAAVWGKAVEPAHLPLTRFLGVYTVAMTLVYAAVPYKTPWCALGFLDGMILLAGVGAAVLLRAAPRWLGKASVAVLLVAALAHLGYQAHRATLAAGDDPGNPYLYAGPTQDVALLAERIAAIAAAHPDGADMHIQVICPDDDYWPLPWYLRRFRRVGWYGEMPAGPPAPLVVIQPALQNALTEYLYIRQPPGKRPLYVPVDKNEAGDPWQLRRHVPLEVWARLKLIDAYRR